MSDNDNRGAPEEDARNNQETRGTCTNAEEGSVLSLVVDIQRRHTDSHQAGRSIDILTRVRGTCVTASQQTGSDNQERQSSSVCGSVEVNLTEPGLARSITFENVESRAEARIEVVDGSRPPPSYTSVEVPEPNEQSSYHHPSPPPTYEQAVGIRYLDRELPIIANDAANIWGYRPQPAYCLRCNAMVLTTVQNELCFVTHLTAAISCVCLCWPCVIFPYFLPIFKEVHHHCPACSTFLGAYRPIPFRHNIMGHVSH